MNIMMRRCILSPVFGVIFICNTMVTAIKIGSRLIGS